MIIKVCSKYIFEMKIYSFPSFRFNQTFACILVFIAFLSKVDYARGFDAPDQKKFTIVETNAHMIDLNMFQNNTCMNHRHIKGQNLGNGPVYKLNIKPSQKSGCFILYNEYDCKGLRLKFLNSAKEKVLMFERKAVQNQNVERLKNFDVAPNSISLCQFPEKWSSDGGIPCGSDYALQVGNSRGIEVTAGKCTDVPNFTNKDFRDNLGELFIHIIPSNQYDDHGPGPGHGHDHDYDYDGPDHDEPQICIETYSKPGCAGEKIQYIISSPLTRTDKDILNKPIKLWHFTRHTYQMIDTDIKSVQRCSCSSSPHHLPPTLPIPEKEKGVIAEDKLESSLDASDKTCHFPHCSSIDTFLKMGNETVPNCGFIFNESQCIGEPIFWRKKINRTKLMHLASQYEGFSNWTIAVINCREYNHISRDCRIPSEKFDKIEDVVSLMLERIQPQPSQENKPGGDDDVESIVSKVEMIVLIIAGTLALIMLAIVIFLGVLLWRKKKMLNAASGNRNRIIPKHRIPMATGAAGTSGGIHQIDPIEANDYVNDITGLQALCKFFANGGYEIPRENINIGNIRDSSAQVIGVGEFSIAFKGILEPQNRTVAVKAMKSGHGTPSAMKRVLKECKIFMDCGKHERFVEFLGVCTEQMKNGDIYVVMEFCDNGPLKSFLVQHRSHFTSLVKDGELKQDEDLKAYVENSIEEGPPPKFNTFQLFKWCWEIADAMEFLAIRKIVHVSLCSRNVMLDTQFKAKISDFHLARLPGEGTSTNLGSRLNMNKERSIPWRFYAVESLVDDIFSTQSDVWTFGIFMWELLTLGATPYPEQMYGGEFTMVLKHGYRLLKPELATIEIYELMLICWYDAPDKRPTFSKLKSKLEGMIHS